jgi:hypothetical protein
MIKTRKTRSWLSESIITRTNKYWVL